MATDKGPETITLPWASDFHCHLRQGTMMETVTPMVEQGGVRTVLAMPNLTPPLTKTQMALDYGKQLQKLAPNVHFILTLYLNPDLTPEEIAKAAASGITAVKVYPSGVTTNSDWGVLDLKQYYPTFAAMQEHNMVLCLHGECPSDSEKGICILNAEERFLATLQELHREFPKLRIVLEHATTKAAVDCVKSLGDTVACTITAHHLHITVDDWAGQPHHFCKPVAKYPTDRDALREIAVSGHPRFFLGSDSAPHPRKAKQGEKPAAGVFTTPLLIPLMATLFDKLGCLDKLEGFVSTNGRNFYQLPPATTSDGSITLTRTAGLQVPDTYVVQGSAANADGEPDTIVPFMAGAQLAWSITSTH
ncbi:dihydroorotase [Coemansia sp. RSA 1821]|nr:dihydroorotase, homodimeric type [Coemansia mojavensis]KAJ1741487.1 dihydroorotase [Coemansia sp. RSA 1086]KAJ1752948.1 dihydroorotase [Coemansia sp. RSA 1821]